ncbi:MAG: trypsin-like peptidase domain-containing protein [Bacteroidota bacterium]|nr:trypsin-like peptidase domain-containing protein [Bacteroidota bacterium]
MKTIIRTSLAGVLFLHLTLFFPACGQEKNGSNFLPDPPPRTSFSQSQAVNSTLQDSRRNAITRAIEICSPAVVGINVIEVREYREMDPFWRMFFGDRVYRENVPSLGSGFLVSSDGYILTNDHVAGNASKITVTMTNGDKLPAEIVGTDPVTDICLLKIDGKRDLPHLTLGNSDDVIVGEWAIAFGNPFGLFSSNAKPTVTVGVISATHMTLEQQERRVYRHMIQTDAAINSGNSGGPLVNSLGEVIGINTVIYTPNQGNVGLGFAIPINRAREIARILKEDGKVDRNFYAGFRVQAVNSAIARAYRLEKAEGVIISDIDRRGSAAQAGLEIADIIVKANDEPIMAIENLDGLIRSSKTGDVIRFEVIRDGKRKIVDMKLLPR